jgi:hypothetical protein
VVVPSAIGADPIGHTDIAPYNICFNGAGLAGVVDWDCAGRTTALLELGFIAWDCVPLYRQSDVDGADDQAAAWLQLRARGYRSVEACDVLTATISRTASGQGSRRIGRIIDPPAQGEFQPAGSQFCTDCVGIGHRPSQPIQFGHHQGVALADRSQRLVQTGPFPVGAGEPVIEIDPPLGDTKLAKVVLLDRRSCSAVEQRA